MFHFILTPEQGKMPQGTQEATFWWSQQNHINQKEQRGDSYVANCTLSSPTAAPWDPVHADQTKLVTKDNSGRGQHQLGTCFISCWEHRHNSLGLDGSQQQSWYTSHTPIVTPTNFLVQDQVSLWLFLRMDTSWLVSFKLTYVCYYKAIKVM